VNWDQVEGKWMQLKGDIKSAWGKLTDQDLTDIEGKYDKLVGKLQEMYGYGKDRAEKEVDDFLRKAKF
jgi:uncharacterized protein YjbJ (UPF0337 family)